MLFAFIYLVLQKHQVLSESKGEALFSARISSLLLFLSVVSFIVRPSASLTHSPQPNIHAAFPLAPTQHGSTGGTGAESVLKRTTRGSKPAESIATPPPSHQATSYRKEVIKASSTALRWSSSAPQTL